MSQTLALFFAVFNSIWLALIFMTILKHGEKAALQGFRNGQRPNLRKKIWQFLNIYFVPLLIICYQLYFGYAIAPALQAALLFLTYAVLRDVKKYPFENEVRNKAYPNPIQRSF